MAQHGKYFEELCLALRGKAIEAVNWGSRVLVTTAGDVIEVDPQTTYGNLGRILFIAELPSKQVRQTTILDLRLRVVPIESTAYNDPERFYLRVDTYGVSAIQAEPYHMPLMSSYEYSMTDFGDGTPLWVHPAKVTHGQEILKAAKAEAELYGHMLG